MENLLTATSSRRILHAEEEPKSSKPVLPASSKESIALQSWNDALRILQSKPCVDDLAQTLQWLLTAKSSEKLVNLKIPGPQTTQLVNAIVNSIVPDYWPLLQNPDTALFKQVRKLLLKCLTSLAGIGAMLARLRALASQETKALDGKQTFDKPKVHVNLQPLAEALDLLENIIKKDGTVSQLWKDLQGTAMKSAQFSLIWKEVVSVLAGSRVLSVTAEASSILNRLSSEVSKGSWVADGKLYSEWLSRNILHSVFVKSEGQDEKVKAIATLLSRAFSLGYTGTYYSINMLMISSNDPRSYHRHSISATHS